MNPEEKIIDGTDNLRSACAETKLKGNKIVLTSGCFDLIHGGHLRYLCRAGKLGYLVVGINSDVFVRRLKGHNGRPIRDEEDRAFIMAGFSPVQLVSIFNCDYELIKAVIPNIYVASKTSHISIWDDNKRVE
ncbi:MAG: adenylyltransferase/cytidyltransferase family protein, partial [Patescibacteria group bacterium]|nr:adenylyltransferase/cytidyltransferase family protein [Patescibacteria group bacterium]